MKLQERERQLYYKETAQKKDRRTDHRDDQRTNHFQKNQEYMSTRQRSPSRFEKKKHDTLRSRSPVRNPSVYQRSRSPVKNVNSLNNQEVSPRDVHTNDSKYENEARSRSPPKTMAVVKKRKTETFYEDGEIY